MPCFSCAPEPNPLRFNFSKDIPLVFCLGGTGAVSWLCGVEEEIWLLLLNIFNQLSLWAWLHNPTHIPAFKNTPMSLFLSLFEVQQGESASLLLAYATLSSPLAWKSPSSAKSVITHLLWSFQKCCWHPSCVPSSFSMLLSSYTMPLLLFLYCHCRRIFKKNQENCIYSIFHVWSVSSHSRTDIITP